MEVEYTVKLLIDTLDSCAEKPANTENLSNLGTDIALVLAEHIDETTMGRVNDIQTTEFKVLS